MLGYRPDEFGLVPNSDGFVLLKELLQSIKEEQGWSYVRLADIREVLITQPDRFEFHDDQIRLNPREISEGLIDQAPTAPPELLYHGARQRAYPHILERGLSPTRYPYVCLTLQEELALRIGRRRDPQPVLIKIHAAKAYQEGIPFSRVRQLIYLVGFLPPTYLEGPPLPEEKPQPKKTPERASYRPAGSFEIDLRSVPKRLRQERERRSEAWKKEARRYRRMRERRGR